MGAAATAVVAVLVLIALATLPSRTQTPFERIRASMPHLSMNGGRQVLWEAWNRNLYGAASSQMIAEHPFFGVGLGTAHLLVTDYSEAVSHQRISPDNAQNWFRHQLAELGLIGSVGWILWFGVLLHLLITTRGEGSARFAALALKGALVGLGIVSLVSMPSQSVAVTLTFWTLVFWYTALVRVDSTTVIEKPIYRASWGLIILIVVIYAGGTIYLGRHDLRVPNRAVRFGWPYRYGAYPDERDEHSGTFRWTRDHAVFVLPVEGRWLRLTAWIAHPDAAQNPVRLRVWAGGTLVLDENRHDSAPVTRYVQPAREAKRIILEADVGRTWRPDMYGRSSDTRDLGVALSWSFVDVRQARSRPTRDRGIVKVGEKPLVETLDVRIERRDESIEAVARQRLILG
jgi:hypothetical protein